VAGQTADIFVSYKAEDRPRVQPLVDALEAEGFLVWWDAHIGGGTNWRRDIEEHLDTAKCVLVAWTKRSVGPEGEFVRDEAGQARRRGTYLPVRFDAVDLPLGFREVQAISLKGWRGDRMDPRYLTLAASVRECITGEHATHHVPKPREAGISRRAVVAGSVGVGALAISGLGGWFLLRPGVGSANTIAVLPFANLSGDPSQNYFSDGIAEELRTALSALGGLKVVARTSSEMLRNVDAITAAKRLSVANVITGSVRRSASTVRVSAQLVDGKSGLERWSQSFDRPLGDVLQIQTDIAENVARALSIELGGKARTFLALGGTKSPEALDYLLRARATEGDDSDKGMRRRVALIEQAIRLDPDYAEAHARKGLYQGLWAGTFAASTGEKDRAEAQAVQSVQRAIVIAPAMSLGHGALGLIYSNQLRMSPALDELRRGVELPGADAVTITTYAFVLSQAGRQSEAESIIGRAISFDPLNPTARWLQSWILYFGRQYAASLEAARRTLVIAPENIGARGFVAWDLLMLGRTKEALGELRKLPADDYRRLVAEGVIAARSGRKAEALAAIRAIRSRYGDAANYQYAQVYAQLGVTDQAIQALDAAWLTRDPGLGSVRVDPFLDPLRKDSRLSEIASRVFA